MKRKARHFDKRWLLRVIALLIFVGCSQQQSFVDSGKPPEELDKQLLKQVSYEEHVEGLPPGAIIAEPPPFALDTDSSTVPYWDFTLDQAIKTDL